MNHEAKHEIAAIVRMYGRELIQRGFIERDETIERALRHIGEIVCKTRPTYRWPSHRLVWEGWEAIIGEATE